MEQHPQNVLVEYLSAFHRVFVSISAKEIQTQSGVILNAVFVCLHLAAAVSIWHSSSLLSAKCFVNTLPAVSRGSGVKQSERRDAAQPVGKHFSKPFLTFRKLVFLTDFCMAADRPVTAPS